MKKLMTALVLAASVGATVLVAPSASADKPNCIDATDRANLVAVWTGDTTVQVKTTTGQGACSDVTLYFSSYSLPATYNGEKFWNNPTAYPQQMFDSKKLVLKAGESTTEAASIKLPNECTPKQVDIYLGPEVTVVGEEGHMKRGLNGNHIIQKTKDDCSQPQNPQQPKQPAQPEQQPARNTLPNTGASLGAAVGISTLTGVIGTATMHVLRRRNA